MDENPVIQRGAGGRPRKFPESQMAQIVRDWHAEGANRSAIARAHDTHQQHLRSMVNRFLEENPKFLANIEAEKEKAIA